MGKDGAPIKVLFKFERETPGAVRYQEVDAAGNKRTNADGAVMGTAYFRKTALGGVIPQELEATFKTIK